MDALLICFVLDEQMPGAGDEFMGDRDRGDLVAAAVGDLLVAGGELRGSFGGLGGLAQDPTVMSPVVV